MRAHKLGAGEIRVEFIDEEFFQVSVNLLFFSHYFDSFLMNVIPEPIGKRKNGCCELVVSLAIRESCFVGEKNKCHAHPI